MATAVALPEGLGQAVEDVDDAPATDLRLWSVTSILQVLDKPALLHWAAMQTALAAVRSAGSLGTRIAEEGDDEVATWLAKARFRKPKGRLSASSLGTVFHSAAQQYALTGVRPDDDHIGGLIRAEGGERFDGVEGETAVINRMLDRFDDWLGRFSPSYLATEVVLYNATYGYAGTADGFLIIDGFRAIVDYKTSRESFDSRGRPKTPYPEAALQLSAYRFSESAAVWRARRTEQFRRRYYLLSDTEADMAVPVPEVDGGVVIHVTPDHCEAHPVRCDETVHRAFLHVLEVARWTHQLARDVIGMPLVPQGHATEGIG